MDKEQLEPLGITGYRLNLALFLRSRTYDIFMISLIILYTILIFLYFAIIDQDFMSNYQYIMYIIELSILALFCIEIGLYILAFRLYYLKDGWNVFDIIIILISIIFVFLDLFTDNKAL